MQTETVDDEQVMWIAVIELAAKDARGQITDQRTKIAKASKRDNIRDKLIRDARAWFSTANPDFINVCQLAGLNPANVINGVLHG